MNMASTSKEKNPMQSDQITTTTAEINAGPNMSDHMINVASTSKEETIMTDQIKATTAEINVVPNMSDDMEMPSTSKERHTMQLGQNTTATAEMHAVSKMSDHMSTMTLAAEEIKTIQSDQDVEMLDRIAYMALEFNEDFEDAEMVDAYTPEINQSDAMTYMDSESNQDPVQSDMDRNTTETQQPDAVECVASTSKQDGKRSAKKKAAIQGKGSAACGNNMYELSKEFKIYTNVNDFEDDSDHDVYVTHVDSPEKFYIRLVEHQTLYEVLSYRLNQFYELNHAASRICRAIVGMMCVANVAQYRLRGNPHIWARVKVRELIGPEQVRVYLLDTGEYLHLHYTKLRHIVHMFTEINALATRCHLMDAAPRRLRWPEESVNYFNKFKSRLLELHVDATVYLRDERCSSVRAKIYDRSKSKLKGDINYQIVKRYGYKPRRNGSATNEFNKIDVGKLTELKDEDLVPRVQGFSRLQVKMRNCVTASLIYVTLMPEADFFSHLSTCIHIYYQENETFGQEYWQVNDKCCVYYDYMKMWCRAIILELHRFHIKVMFIDYGKFDEVEMVALKVLLPQFASIRSAAVKCHLSGLLPTYQNRWSHMAEDFIDEFFDAYNMRLFISKTEDFSDESLPVEFWTYNTKFSGAGDPNNYKWQSLNNKLLDLGFALPDKFDEVTFAASAAYIVPQPLITKSISDWVNPLPDTIKPETVDQTQDVAGSLLCSEDQVAAGADETAFSSEACASQERASSSKVYAFEKRASALKAYAFDERASSSEASAFEQRASSSEACAFEQRAYSSEACAFEQRAPTSEACTLEQIASSSEACTFEQRAYSSEALDFEQRAYSSVACAFEQRASSSEAPFFEQRASSSEACAFEQRASTTEAPFFEQRAYSSEACAFEPKASSSGAPFFEQKASTTETPFFEQKASTLEAPFFEQKASTSEALFFEQRASTSKAPFFEQKASTLEAPFFEHKASTSEALFFEQKASTSEACAFEQRASTSKACDFEEIPVSGWLPPAPLPIDDFIGVASHIDKYGFVYLHNTENSHNLDTLCKAMSDIYTHPDPLEKSYNWTVGEPCVALYSEDKAFYRARIVEVDNQRLKCLVHYIDYGNEEIRTFSELRKSTILHHIPTQVTKCILHGISPAGNEWHHTMIENIYKLIVNIQFIAVAGEPTEDYVPIELKYDDNRYVNDDLVKLRFAVYNTEFIKCIRQRYPKYARYDKEEYVCDLSIINDLEIIPLQIIVLDRKEEYTKMFTEIQQHHRELPQLELCDRNLSCIAVCPDSQVWYRATILQYCETEGIVKVRLVDLGKHLITYAVDLRQIRDEWTVLPPATICAKLHGVKIKPGTGDTAVLRVYKQVLRHKRPFKVRIIEYKEEMPYVELTNIKHENVNELLKSNDLFMPDVAPE